MAAEKKPKAVVLERGRLVIGDQAFVGVVGRRGGLKALKYIVRFSLTQGTLLWLPDPPKTKRGKR